MCSWLSGVSLVHQNCAVAWRERATQISTPADLNYITCSIYKITDPPYWQMLQPTHNTCPAHRGTSNKQGLMLPYSSSLTCLAVRARPSNAVAAKHVQQQHICCPVGQQSQQQPQQCQQEHQQSLWNQQPALHHISRRSMLALTAAIGAAASSTAQPLLSPKPAQAYIVDETVAQSVFALASRSVVSINDYKQQAGADIFEGVGTGIVWDQYGHIVTNYHCVSKYVLDKSGQQLVKVVLDDGTGSSKSYTAKLIGTDAMHDLAVLSIDAAKSELVPIRMGTSAELKVGQSVYAVGNPYGLNKTLTAGVVSGLNRTIPAPTGTRIYGAIQTDASINAGNSGGPMLDTFARLVGVNTASFTRSGSGRGSGVNFALPVDMVRQIVPNLIVYGTASGRGVRAG